MKISKTSWHYRFNDFNSVYFVGRFARGQFTTCSYIRTTIVSILASIVKAFILLLAAVIAIFTAASTIAVPIVIFMGAIPPDVFVGCSLIGWFAVTTALAITLVNQTTESIELSRSKSSLRAKKEPNVFVQSIIDKHNKFCTLVTAA